MVIKKDLSVMMDGSLLLFHHKQDLNSKMLRVTQVLRLNAINQIALILELKHIREFAHRVL